MPLGIRPTVDFVFKMLFGSPENVDLLIDLLNAVLAPASPIVAVEILNPFNAKAFHDDKLSIVDIKARDADGKWYIIEMQTTLPAGLRNRLVYYTAGIYYGQMREGDSYGGLCPVIGICFLTTPLFANIPVGHLRFSLHDPIHNLPFGDQLQLHLVELSKYDCVEDMIRDASRVDQWSFFLGHADRYEAAQLRQLLPEPPFQKATSILEMISYSEELRFLYDDHAKAARDQFSALKEARDEGEAKGRQEGEAIGRQEGEAIGQQIGRIHAFQQMLGEALTDANILAAMTLTDLQALANSLQIRLQDRA